MNRIGSLVLAAAFASDHILGPTAWAEDVQEKLKKLETDRGSRAVKGDVATLEKQRRRRTHHQLVRPNVGQVANVTRSKPANQNDVGRSFDMKVRVVWNTAVITGKVDVKGTLGGKDVTGKSCSPASM